MKPGDLILHIHEKEKPSAGICAASGQVWQLPFENYEGELTIIKEGKTIKIGNENWKFGLRPAIHPAVFLLL